jgi:hypothetical protein
MYINLKISIIKVFSLELIMSSGKDHKEKKHEETTSKLSAPSK